MAQDFEDFRDEDDPEEGPVFMQEQGFEDEFDLLRRQSARASSTFDDMEVDADEEIPFEDEEERSRFSLSSFSPGQRVILATLVLLDIVAIVIGLLVVTGFVSL